MVNKLFENFAKDNNISRSEIKILKIVYIILGVLVLYLVLCQVAYGLGYLIARLGY